VMTPFATLREPQGRPEHRRGATEHHTSHRGDRKERILRQAQDERPLMVSLSNHELSAVKRDQPLTSSPQPLTSALRRCRQPVPARVVMADGRPARVTTDRRGFSGGTVTRCAGPWRTSGDWWSSGSRGSGGLDGSGSVRSDRLDASRAASVSSTHQTYPTYATHPTNWDRDEWDVSLSDGAVYRIFQDRASDAWFVDAIVD
jgi:hypothetical protein